MKGVRPGTYLPNATGEIQMEVDEVGLVVEGMEVGLKLFGADHVAPS
jgi:hypothetical protein